MKVKRLSLKKETLRDLTATNADAVKGGAPSWIGTGCPNPTYGYTCACGKTKGKTCNKQCR